MIWAERWATIARLAGEQRARLQARDGAAPAQTLVEAGLDAQALDVFPLPPGDPLLGGARAVFGGEFVAYDAGLPPTARAFSLAHELGHALLHGGPAHCADADIDEEATAQVWEPPAPVESYSPRQQRELEANAFAAAFLMPPAELRAAFQAGADYATLAARYGVSETAMLHALAAALLGPPPAPPAPVAAPDPPAPPAVALDDSQRVAAEVAQGPVLVDAGPGTGKTRTLIERVRVLLARGVAPENILALTFSNRAAAEMRERLRGSVPAAVDALTVGTFHAFCLQLLQEHGPVAGFPRGVTLIDDVQAAAWLETRLPAMRLEYYTTLANPGRSLPDLLGAISRARDELVDAAGYARLAAEAAAAADPADAAAQEAAARWAEVARVYAVYEALLAEREALDFGGLLLHTVHLLRRAPRLLAQLRGRYRQILVDEYQDMNRASAVLLQLLAGDGHGLWVVGDLRQAIYRFRGASPANIRQFEDDFPGGRRLALHVNYRSDPALVATFSRVATAMAPEEAPAGWRAQRAGAPGPRLWLATAGDADAEATGIAAEIRRRHAAGRAYGDQAVLCRTHGLAARILAALEAADIPALYLGNLFGRDEVRDLLALLALAAGEGSGLLRAARPAPLPVGRAAGAALLRYARAAELSFPAALEAAAEAGLDPPEVAGCAALAATIAAAGPWREPAAFLARVIFGADSPLRPLAADPSARALGQVLAIGQLLALAHRFEAIDQAGDGAAPADDAPAARLRAFLAHVRRLYAAKEGLAQVPEGGVGVDAVRILTVHASKGLEFPVVYVPGLAAGRFPFREMWEPCPPPPGLIAGAAASDHVLEETCLFFVALSRARDELVVSRAERYGKQAARPSPFVELLDGAAEAGPAARLLWPAGDVADAERPLTPVPDAPDELDVEDLESYLHCPRQYEYSRRLVPADDQGAYLRFHRVVRTVVAGLRANQQAGQLPAGVEAVRARLDTVWEQDGPVGHLHEDLYRDAAARLVVATWQRLAGRRPAVPWQGEVALPLGGARVRARVDVAERDEAGGARIVRHRLGKERDEDRKAARLALLRAAAREALGPDVPLRVELEYLATGTVVEVPDAGRYERARLAKLEAAVAGIRAGYFPPAPDEAGACLQCPFWIICPA